jgi:hypothetical protein
MDNVAMVAGHNQSVSRPACLFTRVRRRAGEIVPNQVNPRGHPPTSSGVTSNDQQHGVHKCDPSPSDNVSSRSNNQTLIRVRCWECGPEDERAHRQRPSVLHLAIHAPQIHMVRRLYAIAANMVLLCCMRALWRPMISLSTCIGCGDEDPVFPMEA